jgi:hypothetical protein
MIVLYDRDGTRVTLEQDGVLNRISIHATGYVPIHELKTAYPLLLIQQLIDLKGPIWFADEIAREEDPAMSKGP